MGDARIKRERLTLRAKTLQRELISESQRRVRNWPSLRKEKGKMGGDP